LTAFDESKSTAFNNHLFLSNTPSPVAPYFVELSYPPSHVLTDLAANVVNGVNCGAIELTIGIIASTVPAGIYCAKFLRLVFQSSARSKVSNTYFSLLGIPLSFITALSIFAPNILSIYLFKPWGLSLRYFRESYPY
jgi:hypothetical protein